MSKGSRNRTTNWQAYRRNYDRIFRDRIVVPPEYEEEIRKALKSGLDMPPIVLNEAVPDGVVLLMKDGEVQGMMRCTDETP